MRISIETSKPHLVKELFKCMTKINGIKENQHMEEAKNKEQMEIMKDLQDIEDIEKMEENLQKKQENLQNYDFLNEKEPSFAELLNYMRMLWNSNNTVYVNVLYNIIVYPQFMLSKERCTTREYSIYKNVFNSKNYMPDVVILLYDENTTAMENMLNDPFFKIHVFKVQLFKNMLTETAQMLSDTLLYIYGNYIDDSSHFSYFEQCYANYNCIDKKE